MRSDTLSMAEKVGELKRKLLAKKESQESSSDESVCGDFVNASNDLERAVDCDKYSDISAFANMTVVGSDSSAKSVAESQTCVADGTVVEIMQVARERNAKFAVKPSMLSNMSRSDFESLEILRNHFEVEEGSKGVRFSREKQKMCRIGASTLVDLSLIHI